LRACLLFDLDGTVADTDPVHIVAFREMMAPHGVPIDEEIYRTRISGRTNAAILAEFFPDWSVERHEIFADEKEACFRERARSLIEPMPGLIDLIDTSRAQGIPLGVVTNAPRANADFMLGTLGIADRFDTVVLAEELAHGKPHPLPYATGVMRLGADAGRSIAFEDSVAGLTSARDAGLCAIGIASSQPEEVLYGAGATLVVADFTDPRLAALLRERLG
jgi:HAD superfamily hydrolase (TIGR01509 family)